MRRIGIVVGAFLALLVVLLAVAYVVLQRMDWNRYKEPVARSVAEATGRTLDLGGDVEIEIGLRPGIRVQQIAFSNADWGSRPQMATLDEVVVVFELLPLFSGDVIVDRVELAGLDVLLETRADGSANWQFEPPVPAASPPAREPTPPPGTEDEAPVEAPEPEEALGLLLQRAEIRDSVVALRSAETGEEQRLAIATLLATMSDPKAPLRLEVDAKYGDTPLRLAGDLRGILGVASGDPLGVELEVEAAGATLSASGNVAEPQAGSGIDLALRLEAPELGGLRDALGAELPLRPPLELAGRLTGGGDAYTLGDLALRVGTTRLAGELAVALGGPRPRIDARLASPLIDAADFGGDDARRAVHRVQPRPGIQLVSETTGASASPEPLFSRDPLPLDGLRSVDARVSLAAERVAASSLDLRAVDLRVALTDAKLAVERLRAGLAGGKLDAKLGLDARVQGPARVTLSGTARGVRAGDLASAQGSDTVRDGPVDLDFDVSGRGDSLHAIAASLEGRLGLTVGAATLQNEYAAIALSDLDKLLDAGAAGLSVGKDAPLQCVYGEFGIREGMARPQPLVVHLSAIALFGSGWIDLGKERIKLEFDRVAQKKSVSAVLPPFSLTGPLTEPKAGIATSALVGKAIDLGGALLGTGSQSRGPVASDCRELWTAYQQQKGARKDTSLELQDKLEDKARKELGKKLKGLFD